MKNTPGDKVLFMFIILSYFVMLCATAFSDKVKHLCPTYYLERLHKKYHWSKNDYLFLTRNHNDVRYSPFDKSLKDLTRAYTIGASYRVYEYIYRPLCKRLTIHYVRCFPYVSLFLAFLAISLSVIFMLLMSPSKIAEIRPST